MRLRTFVRGAFVCAIALGFIMTPFKATAGEETKQKTSTQSSQPKSSPSAAPKAAGAQGAFSSKELGGQFYARYQCGQCHGMDMKGGVKNANAQGGEVPSLVHVPDDYSYDETVKLIRNGRSSPADKAELPQPPIYMPSWKGIMTEAYIKNIADFVFSKAEKKSASW